MYFRYKEDCYIEASIYPIRHKELYTEITKEEYEENIARIEAEQEKLKNQEENE